MSHQDISSQGLETPVSDFSGITIRRNRRKEEKLHRLVERVTYLCTKLEEAGRLKEIASTRIIRWFKEQSYYVYSMSLENKIDRFTQDLSFICGRLLCLGLFNRFTYRRIRTWQAQRHYKDTEQMIQIIDDRFAANPRLIDSTESVQLVIIDLITDAEEVHPFSQYHKNWIEDLVMRKATELIGNKEVQRVRAEALELLSEEQQFALGIR